MVVLKLEDRDAAMLLVILDKVIAQKKGVRIQNRIKRIHARLDDHFKSMAVPDLITLALGKAKDPKDDDGSI